MAYLACADERFDVATRILACADRAGDAHGQPRRRPVEELLRAEILKRFELASVPQADQVAIERERLDEAAACALALGLS
jgi:hypothetical protein